MAVGLSERPAANVVPYLRNIKTLTYKVELFTLKYKFVFDHTVIVDVDVIVSSSGVLFATQCKYSHTSACVNSPAYGLL